MVKDHTGRHPRSKHIKIVKKLRKRRRRLMTRQKRDEAKRIIKPHIPIEVCSPVEVSEKGEVLANESKSNHCLLNSEPTSKLHNLLFSESEGTLKNVNTISEQSCGLSNLFAEDKSDTSLGLRSLFMEDKPSTSEISSVTVLSSKSLYSTTDQETSNSNTSSTYNTRSLFSSSKQSEMTTPTISSITTSSDLLGNIFNNETSVNEASDIYEQEQQETSITQYLTQYLDSDDRNNSMTVFVNHLKDIFEHYQKALAIIKKLETEIAVLKKQK